ncbi:MAG: diadenylate cyclase, partial [Phycisphaerales bacterium]
MGSSERFNDLLNRLSSYSWWEVALELLLIWFVVFAVFRFVQGTRAARALKGLLFILIIGTLFVRFLGDDSFARIAYLYDRMLAVIAIALVVIFQPELRRALIRLGETRLFQSDYQGAARIAGEVAPACAFLSKARFGAIIVIERRVGLKALIEGGTALNATITAPLLQTIFHPGSALHDLAVVIRGDRIQSAGVQLPMAGPGEVSDPSFGSRHRAAIGVSKDTDALVIVVSEESGLIRGYHAEVDARELGFEVQVFVMVGLDSQAESELRAFEDRCMHWPMVRECHMLNGEVDFILKCTALDL